MEEIQRRVDADIFNNEILRIGGLVLIFFAGHRCAFPPTSENDLNRGEDTAPGRVGWPSSHERWWLKSSVF